MASEGVRMWAIVTFVGVYKSIGGTSDEAWERFLRGRKVSEIRNNTEKDWNAKGYRAVRVRVTIEEEKSDG